MHMFSRKHVFTFYIICLYGFSQFIVLPNLSIKEAGIVTLQIKKSRHEVIS